MVAFSFYACLILPSAHAGINTWTSLGPAGGEIRNLVIDPLTSNVLYTYSNAGDGFKSVDGGVHWTAGQMIVNSMVAIGTTRFSGSNGSLLKSTDGGTTWTDSGSGLPALYGSAYQLATISSTLYASTTNGVYKSPDGGISWAISNSGLPSPTNILVSVGTTLYAGISGTGIFKSTDGGLTWIASSSGLNLSTADAVFSLVNVNGVLYLTTSSGLFKSLDGGDNWQDITSGLIVSGIDASSGLLTLAYNGSALFLGTHDQGAFKSTNLGITWAPCNVGPQNNADFTMMWNGTALYAGTYDGVFSSNDDGVTWQDSNSGLLALSSDVLGFSAASLFIAADAHGNYKSADQGQTWSTIQGTAHLVSLFVSGSTLFAGDDAGNLLGSVDDGKTWTNSGFSSSYGALTSFTLIGGTIYAGIDGCCGTIYKSTDTGKTWSLISQIPAFSAVTALAAANSTLFVGTSVGIFKSGDGGSSWQASNTGLDSGKITSLAVSGTTLYAGLDTSNNSVAGSGGLFISTDGGANWHESDSGIGHQAVAAMLAVGDIVYAAAVDGVYMSTDGGASWQILDDTGLNIGAFPSSVTTLTSDGRTLYAGSRYGVQSFTYVVPPTINNTRPPNGQVGQRYNFTYSTAGTPPFTYSLVSGSLPPGLTLSTDGMISGRPSTAGTYNLTVAASNPMPPSSEQTVTILISEASGGGTMDILLLVIAALGFPLNKIDKMRG